ncbi:MAG: MOSC domain-containing protein [Acidobacteriota bacterium]|nr:MOSC domain-containing protein [Acidobacteriota bacterium]
MDGAIEAIYIAPKGGAEIQPVDEVHAIANCGLKGDRYCTRIDDVTDKDGSQVTLISYEDLKQIEEARGVQVTQGEHRRNLVMRGVYLGDLTGKRFEVGGSVLEYMKPCPPCSYIESITEPGMAKALVGCGGICARVIESGVIRVGDPVRLATLD